MPNDPLERFLAIKPGDSAKPCYSASRECRWPDARRHREWTCVALRNPGFCSAINNEDLALCMAMGMITYINLTSSRHRRIQEFEMQEREELK